MTDALRKMVKAMAAEFARQRAADDRWNVDYVEHVGPNETVLDGRFDLEKVARAGLAAISEPTMPVVKAGRDATMDVSDGGKVSIISLREAASSQRAMIAAILGEVKP